MQATFDNCNNFNTKLQDTLKGLINANADRKSEIDSLRSDHEELKKVLHNFFGIEKHNITHVIRNFDTPGWISNIRKLKTRNFFLTSFSI